MFNITYQWNGSHIKQVVFDVAWEGLLRAAVFYWSAITNAVNIPNTGRTIKGRGPGGQKKSFTVYENPSKPGNPPHKITGWLQKHLQYWPDKANLIVRVGLAIGAKYGVVLELGSTGIDLTTGKQRIIRPKKAKFLVFWSKRDQKLIFVKQVKQGQIHPRPFILATLQRVMPQLRVLVKP